MKCLVLGSGAFGQALCHKATQVVATGQAQTKLTLWARRPESLKDYRQKRHSGSVETSSDLFACLKGAQALIYALPTQVFRTFFKTIKKQLPRTSPILITAKGLEEDTGAFFDEILSGLELKNPLALLAGPHLAKELEKNHPTLGLLGGSKDVTNLFKKILQGPDFFLETQEEIRSIMIANAFKNVLALLGGILRSEGAGENTLNSFLALGFQEMCRFGAHWGIKNDLFCHPALLGDFMLTTQSLKSRNTQMGLLIGQNKTPETQILAEGLYTLNGLLKRASKELIPLPLCKQIKIRLTDTRHLKDQLSLLVGTYS